MSEELARQKLVIEGRTVDLDKRSVAPRADFLNGLYSNRCETIMLFGKPSAHGSTSTPALTERLSQYWPFVSFTRLNILRILRDQTDVIEAAKIPYW